MKSFLVRFRRFLPVVASVVVLSVVGVLFSTGTSSNKTGGAAVAAADRSAADRSAADRSAADRSADGAATRGVARTPDASVTLAPPVALATTTAVPTTTTAAPAPKSTPTSTHTEVGGASYYAQPWANKGCAHKTLPKGTKLTVTNLATGKSTTCVVNDRGPYIAGRIVDLDTTIFKQLASTSSGVFRASITW